MIVEDPCHRDFSQESLRENAENVSEQWSSRTPVIATCQENPCARIKAEQVQKLPSRLCRESLGENHDNKRQDLGADGFPCI